MIRKTSLVLALAAFASASAFAGGDKINSSSGSSVTSGTGVTVTQGAPSSSVTVLPSTSMSALPSTQLFPGGTQVQASQTTVMGGPAAGGISGSQTIVTRYWVNVPAGVEHRADFQRWTSLR
jgi:hypothetical protein